MQEITEQINLFLILKCHVFKIYAEKMYKVFRDIQTMYVRLVSMLVKECEAILGKPPCKYAIIALGSVARISLVPRRSIALRAWFFRVLT